MTKRPTPGKNHFSEPSQWLLSSRGHLLEIRPNFLMILGPLGLWAGFWAENSGHAPITSSRQWLKKADVEEGVVEFKSTDQIAVSCYCGDIKNWSSFKDRSLEYVRRHHPEQTRANYHYSNGRNITSSYLSDNSWVVEIEQSADLRQARVYFKGGKVKTGTIWQSHKTKSSYERSFGDYLVKQVLLPDTSWQDPEPWLTLIESYDLELTPAFKRQVFGKLLGQFNSDFEGSSTEDLQSQLLRRARQGWWSVNPAILNKLARGAESSKDPHLTKPLSGYLRQSSTQKASISSDMGLAWFDNFLPLSRQTDFTGFPLGIAEYINFLHNNSTEKSKL